MTRQTNAPTHQQVEAVRSNILGSAHIVVVVIGRARFIGHTDIETANRYKYTRRGLSNTTERLWATNGKRNEGPESE